MKNAIHWKDDTPNWEIAGAAGTKRQRKSGSEETKQGKTFRQEKKRGNSSPYDSNNLIAAAAPTAGGARAAGGAPTLFPQPRPLPQQPHRSQSSPSQGTVINPVPLD